VPHAGVLLALAPTSSALTHAYTELKRFSRAGAPRRCDIVIHRRAAKRRPLDAFDSVALTAGRFLGMTLALAGTLPAAPHADPRTRARAGRRAHRAATARRTRCRTQGRQSLTYDTMYTAAGTLDTQARITQFAPLVRPHGAPPRGAPAVRASRSTTSSRPA
jgi:hypothetical protein